MEVEEKKPKLKVYCPICGKPPEEKSICPNCGLENICAFHIYRFFDDKHESPMGCPKCGPRCAVCGVQTALTYHNERAVCSSCRATLTSSDSIKKFKRKQTMDAIQKAVHSIFPIGGLGLGIYYGLMPQNVKMLEKLLTISLPSWFYTGVWSVGGLLIGSMLAELLGRMLNTE